MTATVTEEGPSFPASAGSLPARVLVFARNLPRRMHERSFWVIQIAVVGITALHLLGEAWVARAFEAIPEAFHHIPVVLYLGPISYASLRYGTEGAVLTGLQSAILTLPNLSLWHRASYEWLTELFFVVVVVIVGAVMAVPVERERRANKRLQESERRRLRSYAMLVTQAQEDERKRLARELHDEAAQNVVVMQRDLASLAETLPDHPAAAELCRLRDFAGQTLANMRRLSRGLRPPTLDELGLSSALDQLVSEVRERGGRAAEFSVSGSSRRLPIETELAVFRIGQAAVHNAEQHADAEGIDVELEFHPGGVRLTITDDGCGFETPEHLGDLAYYGKLGLIGMLERAELVGGTLQIDSRPSVGTRIFLEVPEDPRPTWHNQKQRSGHP